MYVWVWDQTAPYCNFDMGQYLGKGSIARGKEPREREMFRTCVTSKNQGPLILCTIGWFMTQSNHAGWHVSECIYTAKAWTHGNRILKEYLTVLSMMLNDPGAVILRHNVEFLSARLYSDLVETWVWSPLTPSHPCWWRLEHPMYVFYDTYPNCCSCQKSPFLFQSRGNSLWWFARSWWLSEGLF